MAPLTISGIDELRNLIGKPIGPSDWVEVTQSDIDKFAEVSRDDQWIHVDVERAERELPTHRTIAHGLLTLALAPEFIRAVARVRGLKRTLNYGANRIRYLAPVPSGSRLRGRVRIADAEDVPPDGLRVTYGVTIEIEGGTRPACVAELIALHYR